MHGRLLVVPYVVVILGWYAGAQTVKHIYILPPIQVFKASVMVQGLECSRCISLYEANVTQ
jgi:hypothetical protein